MSLVKLRSIQTYYGLGNIIDLAFDTCVLRVRNENVCERDREREREIEREREREGEIDTLLCSYITNFLCAYSYEMKVLL